MAEKFRKIVNAPHKNLFRRAINKLTGGDNKKETGRQKTARISDGVVSAAAGTIFWLTSKLTLDNPVLRKMEAKRAKKGSKNPNLVAHLYYYMIMSAVIGGGVAYENRDDIKESIKNMVTSVHKTDAPDLVENDSIAEENIAPWVPEKNTFGAYYDNIRPIVPLLIAELVSQEGVVMRDGMHVVYDDATGKPLAPGEKAKGIPTIGYGSTVMPDGSRVTSDTPPITSDEAYEIARWHIENRETFFLLYCYDIGLDKVNVDNTAEAFAISSIMYNSGTNMIEDKRDPQVKKRNDLLRRLYAEYGYSVPDAKVKEVFKQYPILRPYSFGAAWTSNRSKKEVANTLGNFVKEGRGLYVRRMIEAGILTGEIDPVIILDLPVKSMHVFLEYMGGKKSDFWIKNKDSMRIKPGVIKKFNEWAKNPVDKNGKKLKGENWPLIRDVLPPDIVKLCDSGNCKLGAPAPVLTRNDVAKWKKTKNATYVINNKDEHKQAVALFRAGKYEQACAAFEAILKKSPKNALLRNDLAATYNKLGRYDDAIAQARIIIYDIRDRSQYAAAQYNAGFAYEKKGDLQKALANYKQSVANGNRRVQNDVTRVTNLINKRNKNRFVQGTSKVKKTAYATDAAVYNKRANTRKA